MLDTVFAMEKIYPVTWLLPTERMFVTGTWFTVSWPASLLMRRLRPPTVLTAPAWLPSILPTTTWLETTCLWKTGSCLSGSSASPVFIWRPQTESGTVTRVTPVVVGASSPLTRPAATKPSQARKTPVVPAPAPACLWRKYFGGIF